MFRDILLLLGSGKGDAIDVPSGEDAAKHSIMHRTGPEQKPNQQKMSIIV